MKLNKIMMATIVALGMSSIAHAEEPEEPTNPIVRAADQGSGKINFKGSIIDAACSINPESIDQTVDLGQVSKAALQDGGKSTPRNFTIDLENCTFGKEAKNKVTVTFSGMESDANNGLLGTTGAAKGASIAITDGSGQVISLNKPTKPQELQEGNNTLAFSTYLQGDGDDAALVEGNFIAVADFKLAYN